MAIGAAVPLADVAEKTWQQQVVTVARSTGWPSIYHTFNSRRSSHGFPDLILVRERILYIELKREKTKPTPEQIEWLDRLATAGGEVYLWRPSDLDEAGRILAGRWRYDPVLHDLRKGTDHLLPASMWLPGQGRRDSP